MKNKWVISLAAITALTILGSMIILTSPDTVILGSIIATIGAIAGVTAGGVAVAKKVRNRRKR